MSALGSNKRPTAIVGRRRDKRISVTGRVVSRRAAPKPIVAGSRQRSVGLLHRAQLTEGAAGEKAGHINPPVGQGRRQRPLGRMDQAAEENKLPCGAATIVDPGYCKWVLLVPGSSCRPGYSGWTNAPVRAGSQETYEAVIGPGFLVVAFAALQVREPGRTREEAATRQTLRKPIRAGSSVWGRAVLFNKDTRGLSRVRPALDI